MITPTHGHHSITKERIKGVQNNIQRKEEQKIWVMTYNAFINSKTTAHHNTTDLEGKTNMLEGQNRNKN